MNLDAVANFFKSEKAFSNIVDELTKIISKILKSGIQGLNISIRDNKKEFNYCELFLFFDFINN